MADRISIETNLLMDISSDLNLTAGKIDRLVSETASATRNVRRVASDQVQLIEKLERICQRIAATQERFSKLSRAVSSASSRFESAERQVAGFQLDSSESPFADGQSAAGEENNSSLIGKLIDTLRKIFTGEITNFNMVLPFIQFGNLYQSDYEVDADWGDWEQINSDFFRYHPGNPIAPFLWSVDMINNFRILPDGTIEMGWERESHAKIGSKESALFNLLQGETDTGFSMQDNSMLRLTPHEIDLFGKKITVFLPYINIGRSTDVHLIEEDFRADPNNAIRTSGIFGGRTNPIIGSSGVKGSALSVSGDAGFQYGFDKDGNFVVSIGAGAEANAAEVAAYLDTRYATKEVGYGAGPGAGAHFNMKNGNITVDAALPFMGDWSVRYTLKGDQIIQDAMKVYQTEGSIGKSVMQGDLSGVLKSVSDLYDYFTM